MVKEQLLVLCFFFFFFSLILVSQCNLFCFFFYSFYFYHFLGTFNCMAFPVPFFFVLFCFYFVCCFFSCFLSYAYAVVEIYVCEKERKRRRCEKCVYQDVYLYVLEDYRICVYLLSSCFDMRFCVQYLFKFMSFF